MERGTCRTAGRRRTSAGERPDAQRQRAEVAARGSRYANSRRERERQPARARVTHHGQRGKSLAAPGELPGVVEPREQGVVDERGRGRGQRQREVAARRRRAARAARSSSSAAHDHDQRRSRPATAAATRTSSPAAAASARPSPAAALVGEQPEREQADRDRREQVAPEVGARPQLAGDEVEVEAWRSGRRCRSSRRARRRARRRTARARARAGGRRGARRKRRTSATAPDEQREHGDRLPDHVGGRRRPRPSR